MMLRPPVLLFACSLTLFLGVGLAASAGAAERTFVWSANDIITAVDDFNAALLEHSPRLGRAVVIRRGSLSLARQSCPSLTADPARVVTRVRVLDGPARAALIEGRRTNSVLGDALASMGGVLWFPPATGRVRQPSWVAEPVTNGVAEFATAGFATGEQLGALTVNAGADDTAAFMARVSVYGATGSRSTKLVLAVTTELPPKRPRRRPKRTECFLLMPVEAADVRALVDLLAATPLTGTARSRLSTSLDYALYWLGKDQPQRAARSVKRFAGDVSGLLATEMPSDAGEEILMRSLAVIEALGF